MTATVVIFGFIFGSVIGSFLNVVIYRLYKGKSLGGFSACPACKTRLSPKDLVPIASFFLLSGKCRYCKAKISIQYPLVEIATAILFAIVAFQYVAGSISLSQLAFVLIFISLLVVIFTFDFLYYLIPDEIVLIGLALVLLKRGVLPNLNYLDGLWGALAVGGFFAALFFVSRGRWIGFGDVKLGVFLGLLLGFAPSLVMLMIAYVTGAIIGVFLVAIKQKTMKGVLPFGTFLTAATIIVLVAGSTLVEWYNNLIYHL